MSVLVAILGLALLILIHEMGHFFTARGVAQRRSGAESHAGDEYLF